MLPCTANASPVVILSDEMEVMQQAAELAKQGKVGSAIDLLEQAVAMGEESAELCIYIARLCHSINELRAFANWCHEAMRIDPTHAEPHFLLGKELHRMARWEEADAELEKELIEYCRSKISSIKCPRSIDFEKELPREETGKIKKRLMKDRYWQEGKAIN